MFMEIKCKKCECSHNKGCCCCANKIKIGKQVDCESYDYSEENANNLKQQTAKNMFEIGEPLHPHVSNKEVDIYCDAKCLFNKCGKCVANGITVLESEYAKSTPCCATQIDE